MPMLKNSGAILLISIHSIAAGKKKKPSVIFGFLVENDPDI